MIDNKFGTAGCGSKSYLYIDENLGPDDKIIVRDVIIDFNKDGSIKSSNYKLSNELLETVKDIQRYGFVDRLTFVHVTRKISKFDIFMDKIESLFRRNKK